MKILLFAFLLLLIPAVLAQPELEAYSKTSYLIAGKLNEVKIVLVNLAKPEKLEFGSIEKELLYNGSLTAYNLEIRLESGDADVKTGKLYIPALPARNSVELSFLVAIPQNASGKSSFTLHVDYEKLCNVLNQSGTYSYQYCDDFEIFEIEIEVLESAKPEFRVYSLTSRLYEGEVTKLTLTILNSGMGEARDVEIRLLGFESVTPEVIYLPYFKPLNSSTVYFEVIPKAEKFILALNYLYYENGWKKGYEEIEIPMKIETIRKGLEFALSKSKFERKEIGIIEIAVMNNHAYPISALRLRISEPEGFEFDAKDFLLGYLSPGEVRKVFIKFRVQENASFGIRELAILADYRIIASELIENSEIKNIQLSIKLNPFFQSLEKALAYHGENIITLKVANTGGLAKNVHFKLNPSPGIRIKTPEAYLDRIESGGIANLSFKIDVDKDVIPNNDYRIELSYKAENSDGEEVSGNFYVYVKVLEKGWIEIYYPYILALIIFVLIIALRVKKMR
ncbi:MAG: hypothetical protein NZ879_04400 [Archaeoglobaceae archaeon]|nr:hypothetical protein [Archaeoglobaceae archaeon]MDW8118204.1 hypothetical protein [Archaeoglobaceae archaeon]